MPAGFTVPAAGAKSSKSSSKLSAADEQYLKASLSGDLLEITGGKLAKAKSHNPAVIKLANRLITDHAKSFRDDAKLAGQLGVDVPKSPLPSMVWELKMVAALHGEAFNHCYSRLEVFDHVQDMQESSDEVKDGTNSNVRDSARTNAAPASRARARCAEG